ncbi:CG9981 [Drosophila busckii]|uniref:Phospholipid-transporting ATPase n=1 Tax=Drosophila busckii TaxID=30019 RepID=A0A0M4ET04_DROBS|nr:probable phospholipid-transporting ATPase IF [Drosophila busckii]ALC48588.1 CG9981 [Drosophila busckii]
MAKQKQDKPLSINIGHVPQQKQRKLNRVKTTKYNWLTFIPLNFYEQFRRAVYFYFLLVTIVSFFVNDTMSPMVSLLPLLFVMIVTALKEGLEDYARAKSDRIVNSTRVTLMRQGKQISIDSQFIVPGDLVLVSSASDVPCDLVLLHSTSKEQLCFVNTANLDGETNLKTIHVPTNYDYNAVHMGTIVCEPATPDLYSFNGRIELSAGTQTIPLTIDNLLLRGVRLRGQERVVGCAIYTGMQTKLQLNSRYTGNKSASSEQYINKFIIALILGMVLVVLILYLISRQKAAHVYPTAYYLGPPVDYNSILHIIEDFLSFLILFNYMIPISMYMNIELYRVFGALFMKSDLNLYDAATDQPCSVNASNLNEDLGQINILFSDKTGTLTKNQMNFLQCFIAGHNYLLQHTLLYSPSQDKSYELGSKHSDSFNFFEALALCHTVDVLEDTSDTADVTSAELENLITKNIVERYQASSPDEKALLEGCAKLGLIYQGNDNGNIQLLFAEGSEQKLDKLQYERLQVLEFSSERKRMSVIVRDAQGIIWLYSKGAETSILPRCLPQGLITETDAQITQYAQQGLRTLAVARRILTEAEFMAFAEACRAANTELSNRKELLAECYERIEVDLQLLGATALEDALQDDVDQTLISLQLAGLKIWVLTGDKVETALNIGMSCKHIPPTAEVHFLLGLSEQEALTQRLQQLELGLAQANKPTALVIDGQSISALLLHTPEQFADLALQCKAVLCCRLSPLQKSEIVMLIKKRGKHITAAIGDGANDVSMIQEAHIGIGIMGREGKQAARSADYAIANFGMLRRLLLVHGHYNSERLAFLVLFYCYKNIIITGCMALFQLYDLYSATSVYNELFLWLFDIIYISFSFTYLAMSEKHYSEDRLLSQPYLYQRIAHNKLSSWRTFSLWIFIGALQTFIIFYFAYALLYDNNIIFDHGQPADFSTFGTMLITVLVIVGNLKLLLVSHYMSYLNIAFIIFSIVAFMLSTYLYNLFSSNSLYHVFNKFLSSPPIWLYIVICTVSCLLPDFLLKAVNDMFLEVPVKQNKENDVRQASKKSKA